MEEALAYILVIGFLYFLPSILAISRKKENKSSILVVNIFLGWTVIGWIVSLAWAVSKDNKHQTIVHNHNDDMAEKLEKLANLKDKGVITDKEFNKQKEKILKD